jgi:hypothetical protein
LRLRGAKVVLAVDLIENGIDLERVVTLNVLEAIGPSSEVGAAIANMSA